MVARTRHRRRRALFLKTITSAIGLGLWLNACASLQIPRPEGAARPIDDRLYCAVNDISTEYRHQIARNTEDRQSTAQDAPIITPPSRINIADHIFIVDEDGQFVDAAINGDRPEGRNFSAQMRAVLRAHAAFRDKMAMLGKPDRMLIYVNGGLNSLATSVERAREQVPCMIEAGYFPIFLVWNSSFFDTYWEQVSRIRSGHRYEYVRPTTPIYVLADIGQGIARAPATYLAQFGRFLDTVSMSVDDLLGDPIFDPAGEAPELQLVYDGPSRSLEDFVPGALYFGLTAPVKLVSTPFVDALGKTAWENMVRRTRTVIRKPAEFNAKSQDLAEIRRYPKGTGGFSKFMTELELCVQQDPDCLEPEAASALELVEITMIGHSLGVTVIHQLLRLYDALPYRNLVYLGAASSIREFLLSVPPVMERHPALRFYNLSLHPVADSRELVGAGLVPSGSLLEWIDDMYEHPPTSLDRTLGKWLNVAAASHVFPVHLRDRMVFRVFGFRDPEPAILDPGDPIHHGAFNDTEMHYWLPDFWGKPADWPH